MVGQTTSLASALSIAISGLQTTVGLISTASNNIANAQTPGYSEETANVTSVDYGASFGGSTISSYSRVTNAALSDNYNTATTQSSYYSTLNNYMQQVQTVLDSTDSNPTLSNDVAQFASAWTQYASQPNSSLQQQNVITTGQKLAQDINTTSSEVGQLQAQVVSDTTTSVASFNTTLKQIATLNNQIQAATNAGQQTGSLEDQRDAAINTLSGYTSINIQQRSGGQIAIYTPSGQPLVDGPFASQYAYNGTTLVDSNGNDVSSELTGGSLQAQLQFVSGSASAAASTTPGVGVVAKLNAQLTKLVDAFTNGTGTTTSPFATAYSAAYTSSTAAGGTQSTASVANSFLPPQPALPIPPHFRSMPLWLTAHRPYPKPGCRG